MRQTGRRRWGAIALAAMVVVWITPAWVSAADPLDVHYWIINSQAIKGDRTQGLIQIRVVNTSNQPINNVDLRLPPENPNGNAIEKNVVQLGTIPGRQARVAVGHFTFSNGTLQSGKPISWRLDFDDASHRNHKQVVVTGRPDDRRDKGGKK